MRRTRLLPLWVILGLLCAWRCEYDTELDETQPWHRLGPGGGGSTFLPTFSYHHSGTFLLRCDMTGTYLSRSGGQRYDQINFPGGSSAFAFDPSDSLAIYIGSKALHKSIDGGHTWESVFPLVEEIDHESYRGDHADYRFSTRTYASSALGQQRISCIRVDPSGQVFFAIGNVIYYGDARKQSWQTISLPESVEFLYTNETDLSAQVLAFTPQGTYAIQKEAGQFIRHAYPEGMTSAFSFTGGIDDQGNTRLYGLSNEAQMRSHGGDAPTSVWSSLDQGRSWSKLNHQRLINPGNLAPTFSKVVTSEGNATVAYLVTSSYVVKNERGDSAHWYGALRSEDGGMSWEWVWKGGGGSGQYGVRDGQDADNLSDGWVTDAFGGEYIRIIDVGVSPYEPDVAILTDWYRAMKTEDGGVSWQDVYSIQEKGRYRSTGLDVTTSYGVHFDPFDQDHIMVSYTDIGCHQSRDGGTTWERSTTGIPTSWHNTCYWMVYDPAVEDKIWSAWSSLHDFPRGKMTRDPKWTEYGRGGVAQSVDGGKSWSPVVEGLGSDSPTTSIVLDPNSPVGSRTLYAAVFGKGVFKSIDDGLTWTPQNRGLSGSLAAFELTVLPDGTLYLITSPTPQHRNGQRGREVFFGALYRSYDGATSWERLELGQQVLFPNGLAYDPTDPTRLYLGCWADIELGDLIGGGVARETGGNEWFDLTGGILRSEDGGDTWLQIFDPDHYVYDVTVDQEHPQRLYCNTFDRGAYRSDDGGDTWKRIQGYDFHWGHRVIPDPHRAGAVYLTTFGSSVWHGFPVIDQ